MKALICLPSLLLFISCGMCGCSQQAQETQGWSPNPARRGKTLFEGAQMGWHAAGQEEEH